MIEFLFGFIFGILLFVFKIIFKIHRFSFYLIGFLFFGCMMFFNLPRSALGFILSFIMGAIYFIENDYKEKNKPKEMK